MKKLSSTHQQRLLDAIDDTVKLVNSGESPTDAVYKIAIAKSLDEGEIELVARAYNTGRTTKQREDNNDLLSKAAEFDLADYTIVKNRIYSSCSNFTAEELFKRASQCSVDFSLPPDSAIRLQKTAKSRERFDAWLAATPPPTLYEKDPEFEDRRLRKQAGDFFNAIEVLRHRHVEQQDKLHQQLHAIGDALLKTSSHKLAVVKKASSIKFGKLGDVVCDAIKELRPDVVKIESLKADQNMLFSDAVLSQVKQAIDTLNTYDKAATDLNNTEKCMLAMAEVIAERGKDEYDLLLQKEAATAPPGSLRNPLTLLGTYSILKDIAANTAANIEYLDNKDTVDSAVDSIGSPPHEAKLRQIHTRANLQNLMSTNKLISGYSPDEVATVFNEVSQIAPSVADKKLIMQSIFERRLAQGGLDTFDAAQIVDLNNKILRRDKPDAEKSST